MSFRT
jgi:diphosphate--fructose-6-phosphate 1-phosphotransferase